MKAVCRALVGVALLGWAGGCAVMTRQNAVLNAEAVRAAAPRTVAVLPFHNASPEPLAAAMARDALYYVLADRGFELLNLAEIDRKVSDRDNLAALARRGPNGGIDAEAAGRIFGADAIAIGRVLSVQPISLGLGRILHIQIQVWLMDTRTQKVLWSDTASGWVRQIELPRRTSAATPAELRQVEMLRLCRAFDALMQRLARRLPLVAPPAPRTTLAIHRLAVQAPRPVVSAGDRIDIVAEGTPGCLVSATLGSLGKSIPLEESAAQPGGVYRGAYTVEPGDNSSYCRVAVTLVSGGHDCRRVADVRSAFVIDTTPPDPPTDLAFETRPSGVTLRWAPPASGEVAHYMVYRSESTTGGVRLIDRPIANYCEDRTAVSAGRYVYFVKALDGAGNPSSSSAELIVDLPGAGPTSVGGKIEGHVRWTALGGPYRVRLDVDVTPGSLLYIEPGTQIEIPPGMEITVRGKVEALGRPDNPIVISGTESSRGFHLNDVRSELHAAYVTISGARRGVEITSGQCHLEHVTLQNNQIGIMATGARQLSMNQVVMRQNQYGAILGGSAELRECEFLDNGAGLRLLGEGVTLNRCRFNNRQRDIEKIGSQPYSVDNNIFATADPTQLCRRLWGNVTCSTVLAPRRFGGRERVVRFEPVKNYLARAEMAAVTWNWEKALSNYEAALVQERNRDIIGKALTVYKQIVALEGETALARQTDFCQSAALAFPNDVALLQQLAELYFQQGNGRMAREVCTQILKVDPKNDFAKKNLAAIVTQP